MEWEWQMREGILCEGVSWEVWEWQVRGASH